MSLSRRREALFRRLHDRRSRQREGLFLVEGVRGVEEALAGDAEIRAALFSSDLEGSPGGKRVRARLQEAGVALEEVTPEELTRAADTEAPQGVVLACVEPGWSLESLVERGRPRLLVLDGVQDPGNCGTLIRAAAAFGIDGVVALDGTVDPWNPKSVRAAAGGGFRTRVVRVSWSEFEPWLDRSGVPLLAAAAGGEDVEAVHPGPAWALAVGNEGAGLRDGLRLRATRVLTIPMPGGTESLNAGVAGSILLYALVRPDISTTPAEPGGDDS